MKTHVLAKILILLGFSIFSGPNGAFSQSPFGPPQILRHPLAGHPVELLELHPSDKLYPFLEELQKLKLILLEPGIIINQQIPAADGVWYYARVFNIRGKTESFSQRKVLTISTGRFR